MGLFGKKSKNTQNKKAIELKKELRKLIKKKKYDDALKIGRKILEKVPHENDVLFIVGGIYYMRDQHKTAISFFERALEIGQYDTHVLLLKANSHFTLGDTTQCKACCEKILEIDPKNKGVEELYQKMHSNKHQE